MRNKNYPTVINYVAITAVFMALTIQSAIAPVHASGGRVVKNGYVLTRGLVKGPAGQPIFAEFDEQGIAHEINGLPGGGEATGTLENAQVISGDAYRLLAKVYLDFKAQHAEGIARGATVMTRAAYESYQGQADTLQVPQAGGAPTLTVAIPKPALRDGTGSVLVRNHNTIVDPRLLPAYGPQRGTILLESPIDLRAGQLNTALPANIKSVLLNNQGQIVYTSAMNIGYRAAYIKPDDGSAGDPTQDNSLAGLFDTNGPKGLWGPVKGAKVLSALAYDPTYTDGEGRYLLPTNITPCPGFYYIYDYHIYAEMRYQTYHPQDTRPYGKLYYKWPTFDICVGYGEVPLGFNLAALMVQINLLAQSAQTNLSGSHIPANIIVDAMLLNGEVVISNGSATPLPIGETKYSTATGKLESISADDFDNTDFHVYRVSTGKLVTERGGLDAKNVFTVDGEGRFIYRILLPGQRGLGARRDFGQYNSIEEAQTEAGLVDELQGFEADFIRAGEQLKIIAINRATGYIGTYIATIGSKEYGNLDIPVERIIMQPPNLKIRAERVYQVTDGPTKGEDREYQISFEGSALKTDTQISISTEWLDQDGGPLPEDLKGYLGRLAKVVGSNRLGGQVATFEIKPGSHTQLVKFKGDILGSEHFYVHVAGDPHNANFSAVGAGDGALRYRPKNYVPLQVPSLNEAATQSLRLTASYSNNPVDVPAVYDWSYKPEMQFSVFDLDIKKLNVKDSAGNIIDILDANKGISSTDQSLEIIYDLLANANAPLQTFGPSRELVIAVGLDTQTATSQAGQTLTYTNLAQLATLKSSDLLSIRLYQSGDMENILWEYSLVGLDGPNMDLSANKISLGTAVVDSNATSQNNPLMPDLDFKVTYPKGQEIFENAEYHWQFMVEYIVPLAKAAVTRKGLQTTVSGEKDGFIFGSDTSYTTRDQFSLNSSYTASGKYHGRGKTKMAIKKDCSGAADCIPWGTKFGGGFIYAAVRVVNNNPPAGYDPMDIWLTWGVGDCTNTACTAADYGKRNQLLALQPGKNLVQNYINNLVDSSNYVPSSYGNISAQNVKDSLKGIAGRETTLQHMHFNAGFLGAILKWMKRGMPTVAGDGGFGSMQLTQGINSGSGTANTRPTYTQIWNWKKHIAKAKDFYLAQCLKPAVSWLKLNNHQATSQEIIRGSLSRYNGGSVGGRYHHWVTQMLDTQTIPPSNRKIPLKAARFPHNSNNQPTRAVVFGQNDYYRDLLFCDHKKGPAYTTGISPQISGNCTNKGTSGFYQEYKFDTSNYTFNGASKCLNGSSNCYSDRRITGLFPVFSPDSAKVPEVVVYTP